MVVPHGYHSVGFRKGLSISGVLLARTSCFRTSGAPVSFNRRCAGARDVGAVAFECDRGSGGVGTSVFDALRAGDTASPFSMSRTVCRVGYKRFKRRAMAMGFGPRRASIFASGLMLSANSSSVFVSLSTATGHQPRAVA